ncbi:hypothetical protein ON010_g16896 [Phytophthora cinnamomi]|nr:hypothetical protein ON010_g16896 [Phytophthora cinnamomi]
MPTKIKTPEEFNAAIGEKQLATVQFSTPWCGCKMVAPKVAQLTENECLAVKFLNVSTEELENFCKEIDVDTFPAFRVYKDGDRMQCRLAPAEPQSTPCMSKRQPTWDTRGKYGSSSPLFSLAVHGREQRLGERVRDPTPGRFTDLASSGSPIWCNPSWLGQRRVRHPLVALEVGTFVSAVMSAYDEIVLKFVRGVARVVRNQPGGEELLEWLTFGVPKNGKAPTDDWEIKLIKNLVFINLCAVEVRLLWKNFHASSSWLR